MESGGDGSGSLVVSEKNPRDQSSSFDFEGRYFQFKTGGRQFLSLFSLSMGARDDDDRAEGGGDDLGRRRGAGASEGDDDPAAAALEPKGGVGYERANEVQLGELWRCEKARDFEWRVRCLGLDRDPEALSLLRRMVEATEDLNAIGESIARGEVEPKWWLNGEYDCDGAEEHNDAGAELFKSGRHADAFERFTSAIRLWPSRAVYHANRASAALKVGDFEVCAADCEEALRIDPSNDRVAIRCATALRKLGRPLEAEAHYRRVLSAAPDHAKASRGLRDCLREGREAEARRRAQEERARAGTRAALPLRDVGDDWNDRLYSLTEMLGHAGEDSLSAHYSVIEATIMCRRYADALERLKRLATATPEATATTTEHRYLEAEALWRSGAVSASLGILSSLSEDAEAPQKVKDLSDYLGPVQAHLERARECAEDDRHAEAAEAAETVEGMVDPAACSGLLAAALGVKAEALARRNQTRAALEAVTSALEWEPENQRGLLTRARLRQRMRDYRGAMADLSVLQSINPATPDIFAMMQSLAARILEAKDPQRRAEIVSKREGFDPYALLEVEASATDLEVRRAYRRLAGQWHPDKWAQRGKEEQEEASARFQKIRRAYEALVSEPNTTD